MKTIEVANVLLQNTSGDILLLQRSSNLRRPYHWGLPGGMVDANENPEIAAIRELYEETGITEKDIAIGGISRFLLQTTEEKIKVTNLYAKLTSGILTVTIDPVEHIAYKWASESEIYDSQNLLPCAPTMIALTLGRVSGFTDLTRTDGMQVEVL